MYDGATAIGATAVKKALVKNSLVVGGFDGLWTGDSKKHRCHIIKEVFLGRVERQAQHTSHT